MAKEYAAGDQVLAADMNEIVRTTGLYAASTTGNDTYVITVTPTPTNYTAGDEYTFKPDTANTGACSLNVNSKGAKAIKLPDGNDPPTNYIAANSFVRVKYDGTNFVLINALATLYAAGVVTASTSTTQQNVDRAITLSFVPKFIRIKYFLKGHDAAGATNAYFYRRGEAVFQGTTLLIDTILYGAQSSTNGGTSSAALLTVGSAIDNTTASYLNAGDVSGATNSIKVVMSILSIDASGFTVRFAYTINGSNSSTAEANAVYEAFA